MPKLKHQGIAVWIFRNKAKKKDLNPPDTMTFKESLLWKHFSLGLDINKQTPEQNSSRKYVNGKLEKLMRYKM